MNNLRFVFSIIVISLVLFSFVANSFGVDKLPRADAKEVFSYLTSKAKYRQWPLFPKTSEYYKGRHPHGALLTTFVSPDALTAIKKRRGQIPDGGFIIKENYSAKKELMAITVMYRIKGYDPEAGDWYWAKYTANGTVQKSGRVRGCIGCHSAAIQNDWVFVGTLN